MEKKGSSIVELMKKFGEVLDYLEDNYTYYNSYIENDYFHNDFIALLDCFLTKDTNQAIDLIKKLCDKENF